MMNQGQRSEAKNEKAKEYDEMTRPTKRTRFESDGGSTLSNFTPRSVHRRGHRFLRLHLQLLRALYQTDVDTLAKNTTTTTTTTTVERTRSEERNAIDPHDDDPPLTNELCTTVESFLRDRGRVQSLDTTVQHYRDLYEDVLDFMDEQGQKEGLSSHNGSSSIPGWPSFMVTQQASHGGCGTLVHANNILRQSLFLQGAQQSPFVSSSHFYQHPLQPCHPLRSSGLRVNGDHHLTMKPFGLVAGLIQAKYQNSVDHLQETTIPFEPLITEVRKRIETLESLLGSPVLDGLHHYNDLGDSLSSGIHGVPRDYLLSSTTAVKNDDEEERLARVETKVKLWKLLEMDLLNP